MALKDLKKYFDKTQDTYLRCKENQEELIREYKEGNVSQEQVENYQKYLADLKLNYDRLAYIMYLLGTPQRKSKKGKYDEANKDLVNYFKENKATKEDVYLENKYSLSKLNDIIVSNKHFKSVPGTFKSIVAVPCFPEAYTTGKLSYNRVEELCRIL